MSNPDDQPQFDGTDVLLPSQFYDDRTPIGGEQKLLLALLVDAINQINWDGSGGKRRRAAFAESAAWVKSLGRYSIVSFETVCDALGIDFVALRERLKPYLTSGGNGPRLRLKESSRAQHMTANKKRRRK